MTDRRLPSRPSLEHARKAAKALLRDLRARDPEAAARMRRARPGLEGQDDAAVFTAGLKLADAQHVVAREHGFPSWPRLKARIESLDLDFQDRVNQAMEAAIEGRLEQARELLDAQPEIAVANLFAAATFGEAEAVRAYLERDPGQARARGGPRGWEPLLYLGLSRFLGRDVDRSAGMRAAARQLLDAGADPNAFTVMDSPEFKQTPLYGAAGLANDSELCAMLLDAGADPNDATEFVGSESLYHASEHRDTRCLKLLLEAGPDPDKVSYCLGRKLDFEDPEGVALYLAHGADPNFRNPFGDAQTRLHKAVINGRSPEIVAMLLEAGADPNLETATGDTALALAYRLGRNEEVALLLEHGGDEARVREVDRFLGACARGDAAAVGAALEASPGLMDGLDARDQAVLADMAAAGRAEATRRLLDAGFDPNARGDFGTALNMAAWRGHAEIVTELLARGADPAILNDYGGSALGSALHGLVSCHGEGGMTASGIRDDSRDGDYARVIGALLAAGADSSELPRQPTGVSEVDAVIEAYRR